MNVHPVTFPGHRFAIIAIVHIATIVAVAGALALALTPLLAKVQSGTAFIRVNQLGYATTASKRAYLMASADGLLFGPGAPPNLVGTTGPITQVFASVVCANGPVISTSAVTFSKDGDAHINQQVALPAQCVGPIVLIRAALDGEPWIAASGS